MALNIVRLGTEYFPNPSIGRPLSNAKIFVGIIDLDPEILANQKQISVQQEDGTIVPISQPVLTGAGGIPLYQGSPVTILVDGNYSLKVLSTTNSQIYFIPNVADFDPTQQVDNIFNLTEIIGQSDGDSVFVFGYFTSFPQIEFNGGGQFVWQANLDKNNANGGTIIDPSNIGGFDGTPSTRDAFLAAQGGGSGLGCWVRINIENINVSMFGPVGDGVTEEDAPFEAASTLSNKVDVSYSSNGYNVTSAISVNDTTFIFADENQLTGTATYTDLNGVLLIDGYVGGVLSAPELRDKGIEIVSGVIRQQGSQSVVSITRSGSIATVTQTDHGYPDGAIIDIAGADQSEYNLTQVTISNTTTDTYDYTVSGTPTSPATGTITARRPQQWDWIKDSGHEPIGVDDSAPLIADGLTLSIPYTKTYSKVLSFIAAPDETLSSRLNVSIGASVGTSNADLQMSLKRILATAIRWTGSTWDIVYGANQGGTGQNQVNISDTNFAGSILTLTHDAVPGFNVDVSPRFVSGVTTQVYLPVVGSVSNTSTGILFSDTTTGSFVATEDTNMSVFFSKDYSSSYPFDGSNSDAASIDLETGNIWFFGIMQV